MEAGTGVAGATKGGTVMAGDMAAVGTAIVLIIVMACATTNTKMSGVAAIEKESTLTKQDWIDALPTHGPWRAYVRDWHNINGGEEGLNGHIMAIWPRFWLRFYKGRRKLLKA